MDNNADARPAAASENATQDETTVAVDTGAEEVKQLVTVEDDDPVIGDDDEDNDEQPEAEEGDAAGDRPARRSRSRRYKDRIARLERELAEARREPRLQARVQFDRGDDDLVAPDERDYAYDYLAYDRALREYQTRKAVRDETRRQAERQAAQDRHLEHRERVDAYQRRLADVR